MSGLLDLEKYDEFVGNLELIDDEDMRFEYIIDVGKKAGDADFPEVMKVDANLMHGCMSKVWIIDRVDDGRTIFLVSAMPLLLRGW